MTRYSDGLATLYMVRGLRMKHIEYRIYMEMVEMEMKVGNKGRCLYSEA